MENTHKDCKNYLAVDVFKGICKVDKININADDESCEKFSQIEKCRYCLNYSSTDEFLGRCMQKADAYPDMIAKTCDIFEWKQKGN
jgi:4-hydroxyphenylacetate decarboxylase small subunit